MLRHLHHRVVINFPARLAAATHRVSLRLNADFSGGIKKAALFIQRRLFYAQR
ncbi:Uncharacterized protein EbC_24360 [Erwinia billingiae Eb661]|jgi:hypothetical protein|uniref:Uncharacterized protein n=1 Tax=Erwinia billingiae (strain Eb661) TaxID=634500 RepID=D8MT10_ERWBE|nr:Uncharacterized protein EbC_24360 [Erwinia billingiae Eb661]